MVKFINVLLIGLFLTACSTVKPQYIYQEVKVPVKCQVKKPEKPHRGSDNFEYLKNILIYTEALEVLVDGCVE